MKNLKNLFAWLLPLTALALLFTGCPKGTDPVEPEEPVEDTTDYLESGDEVTVNVGDSLTVYAKGKTSVDAFDCEGLTITPNGEGAFEISAAETMTDAAVSVNFNDGTEGDDGIDVTVYVYDPCFTLNITLDEAVAENAAEVKVAYGSGGVLKETVDAIYEAGGKNASAKLKKEYADSHDWFSPVVIKVYDSESNEISVDQSVAYFCYSATSGDGYIENNTITITAGTSELTFTINFEGFEAESVTGIVYTKVEDDFDTSLGNAKEATVTVADDGASATFVVEKTYVNDSGYFQVNFANVVVTDTDSITVALSSGNTNSWFEFKEGMETTLAYVALTDADYTESLLDATSLPSGLSGSAVSELVAVDLMPSDAKAFKVVYTPGDGEELTASKTWLTFYSDSSWSNPTKLIDGWAGGFTGSETNYTVYITGSSDVSAFTRGGFYIAGADGTFTGTIAITYAK